MPDEPQGPANGGGRRKPSVLPLHPLVGPLKYVPSWAFRPGSFEALAAVAGEMQLWLAIYSRSAENKAYSVPCIASREQLARTLCVSVRTISTQIKKLSKAALLFELNRGVEPKSRRNRPPARWALDPLDPAAWRQNVEKQIDELMFMDGQSTYWRRRALASLDSFERRSAGLANRILADVPDEIAESHRKRKSRKQKRRRNAESARGAKSAHEVVVNHLSTSDDDEHRKAG